MDARVVRPTERWPLIGRDAELAYVRDRFEQGRAGLIVAGAAGVGKSRLGIEALQVVRALGARPVRVTGIRSMSRLPLAAFSPLVPFLAKENQTSEERAALLRRCRDGILGENDTARIALLVDDAHMLDTLSLSLVQQLVQAGVFLLACIDYDDAATEAVVSLWKDDGIDRVDLDGLGVEGIEALLAEVLDGPIDWATARRLAEASSGNLLFLRELVNATLEARTLREDMGIWRLVGALPTSPRLAELVEARLGSLSADAKSVLEVLAFGEPLALSEFAHVELSVLHELERRSIIASETVAGRVELRLAHSVYGQVLRERTPHLRVHQILNELADRLEATGPPSPDNLLRIAAWRLDGDGSRPESMLHAAHLAHQRYDYELAEQLARRVIEMAPTFEARLFGAQLAALQARGAQAEAELVALAPTAATDRQRALVALARMDNLVFRIGHVEIGLELAEKAEADIGEQAWRDEIAGKRSSVVAGTVGPAAALEIAAPLLEQAHGRALIWACYASAYAFGRTGQLEDARRAAARGHAAHHELVEPFEWPAWRHTFHDAEALCQLGHFEQAQQSSLGCYYEAVEQGATEAQAWFAWQLSMHAEDRGYPRTATRFGRLAVSLFRELGRPQLEYFARGYLAIALAIGGSAAEATATLEGLDELGLTESRYFGVDLLRARAWASFVAGDLDRANRVLLDAAALGRDIGDGVGEASSLHAIARLGSRDDHLRARLRVLAERIDGPLVAARADHVDALATGDADRLDEIARRFIGMGAHLLATEAAAAAAAAWQRRGRPREAARSRRLVAAEADVCEEPITLEPSVIGPAAAELTHAELRVALLAIAGRTNREIADELVVSIRTVQNQMQSVYGKLGIRGRAELAAALGRSGEHH